MKNRGDSTLRKRFGDDSSEHVGFGEGDRAGVFHGTGIEVGHE